MRIAIGSLMQESNTFNPVPTQLGAFEADYLWRGQELLERFRGKRVEVAGFLDTLDEAEVEVVPLLAAHACSGGPVLHHVFVQLRDELLERCRAAGPLDGILLALHGAMVTDQEPDAEGALLETLASELPGVPVAASLDLHAHVTPRMVANANVLVGYRTYPHVDMYETGRRTAQLLIETLEGRVRPVMALSKRQMVLSPVNARTDSQPLAALSQRAEQLERTPEILAASLFPVQPWLDVPDLGFSALVVANDFAGSDCVAKAEGASESLAEQAWEHRAEFEPELLTLEAALDRARSSTARPVVIGDAGDAPSCGASGDNPSVLQALLGSGFEHFNGQVLLTLCDPDAVKLASATGIRSEVELRLGHGVTRQAAAPAKLRATVTALRDAPLELEGPGAFGMPLNPGPMCLVTTGALHLVLLSMPVMEWDPALYRSMGLDPSAAAIVFVKSPSHFRAAYSPIAGELLIADTPGASRCNMRELRFSRVGRPLYPIEEYNNAS